MPDNTPSTAFVDTNIWLYAFIETEDSAKSEIARRLVQEIEPVISTQVINEVCVNLLQQAHFTEEQIGQLIGSFYEKYLVIELNKSILMAASRLRQQYSLSFWNSLIAASALYAGVSVLYSEDLHHGLLIEEHLQVRNPFI